MLTFLKERIFEKNGDCLKQFVNFSKITFNPERTSEVQNPGFVWKSTVGKASSTTERNIP